MDGPMEDNAEDPSPSLWPEALWGAALCGTVLFLAGVLAVFIR